VIFILTARSLPWKEKKIPLEKVVCPKEIDQVEKEKDVPEKSGDQKVISLADLKKKSS
jgi:hypothetical protein